MRLEIPECRRCCCCFPLRHGIIVFGYLNLIFSLFLVAVEVSITVKFSEDDNQHTMMLYKGVMFYSQMWFAAVLFLAEIIFNIVLLVGAHMKKTKLLRAYYYYGITTTLASLVTFIIIRSEQLFKHVGFYALEACFVLTSLGIQAYLLLLVRSELLKMRHNNRLCYVNHATETIVDTPVETGRNPF